MWAIGMRTPPTVLLTLAAVFTVCAAARWRLHTSASPARSALSWMAAATFVFYLTNTPVIRLVVKAGNPQSAWQIAVWFVAAFVASSVVDVPFELVSRLAIAQVRRRGVQLADDASASLS